ncbi:MAG TPA: hypothetical protein VGG78_09505 [Gemmatimonadaceae bacterium]|jgi:hypothetical protein
MEGRSKRAQALLTELAPLTLGETLEQARSAVPGLRVHHAGDQWTLELAPDTARPLLAGVIVTPNPAQGDSASGDAVVESVEFLLTPAQALRLRAHTLALLGEPTSLACAGRSISETDSVIEWERNQRGGVLFTTPQRRLNGEPVVARLFVYSSSWDPRRALSGYGIRTCDD